MAGDAIDPVGRVTTDRPRATESDLLSDLTAARSALQSLQEERAQERQTAIAACADLREAERLIEVLIGERDAGLEALARLTAERERLTQEVADEAHVNRELSRLRRETESQLSALSASVEALRAYVQHKDGCPKSDTCMKCGGDHRYGADHLYRSDEAAPCTCGLSAALAALGGTT